MNERFIKIYMLPIYLKINTYLCLSSLSSYFHKLIFHYKFFKKIKINLRKKTFKQKLFINYNKNKFLL